MAKVKSSDDNRAKHKTISVLILASN